MKFQRVSMFWSDLDNGMKAVIILTIASIVSWLVIHIYCLTKKYSKVNRAQTKTIKASYCLKKGMTKEQACQLLGEPMIESNKVWLYRQFVYSNIIFVN